jgi:hypothetical protein
MVPPPTMTEIPPLPPAEFAPPEPREPRTSEVLVAAFGALGYALSARALLFLALIGAFTLGVMAMLSGKPMSLAILAAYSILTVIPMVVLELRKR